MFAPDPATARSSFTTDASKATASSSRICTSAVGSSGTAGSTRSSWTRRGHRLATYALSGGAEAAPRIASAEYKKLHTMAPETKARSRKHL